MATTNTTHHELYTSDRDSYFKRSQQEIDKRIRYYKWFTDIYKYDKKRFGHFIIPGIPTKSLNDVKTAFDTIGGCRLVFSKIVNSNQYYIIQLPKTTSGYEVDLILLIRFFTKMKLDSIINNYPYGFDRLAFTMDELAKADCIYMSAFKCGHVLQCVKCKCVFETFYPLSSRQYPNTITCLSQECAKEKRLLTESKTVKDVTIVQSFVRKWLVMTK